MAIFHKQINYSHINRWDDVFINYRVWFLKKERKRQLFWETPEIDFSMKRVTLCSGRRRCSFKWCSWGLDVSICCHLSDLSWPQFASSFQNPNVFRVVRKRSVVSQRTRELFQCATWTWVEHMFIFTVRYEGLGTCHPAVSLWAPEFYSTQPQLRHTRSCLNLFLNTTWQITVLYIVWSPSAAMTLCSTPPLCHWLLCVMSALRK